MPTTTVGLYEVTLEQTASGQQIRNVWHYLATLGQDDEQDLVADAFDETIMTDLAGIINSSVAFDLIRVANLTGIEADAVQSPSQGSGNVVGLNMTPVMAASFRMNRTTKETRNGSKRFAGLIEENVQGTTFAPAYLVDLQAFESLLAGQISTVGLLADPVILHKPDVAGVWTYNEVASVTALNRVTTQNSRKSF